MQGFIAYNVYMCSFDYYLQLTSFVWSNAQFEWVIVWQNHCKERYQNYWLGITDIAKIYSVL